MVQDDSIIQRLNAIKLHTDPIAQAQLIGELRTEVTIRNKDISDYLEMQPSYLSHLIRIARLPELILDGYHAKHLSFTHLVLISRLKTYEDMVALYEEVLKHSLTASQTESRIRDILYHIDSTGKYLSNTRLTTIKNKISSSLDNENVKVSIVQTRIKAKVLIEINGNLDATSHFLDSFGSRFRQKRERRAPQYHPPVTEDITGAENIDNITNKMTNEDTQSQGSGSETRIISDDTKYRFDPDF